MTEGSIVDLIRLVDGESGLEVKVLGRTMPGVLTLHDYLDAEIVVTSGFAQGRLNVCLAPDDLDNWSQVLQELAAGRNAVWMDDGRNPEIRFELSGHDGIAVFVVADMAASGTSVRVSVRLAGGWAEEHQERLQHVRDAWPQEVVETSPGAYEWRP
ncbi:DUF5959 family protein [Streptomyces sp. MI02-2A]|uniref:DUF5959 family protein n=1 Tax=unclassified Streptomyces TaxID=2593676 RepID=UPI000E27EA7A|nr:MULTISPECIES: DUF5959 family protein [unclassified Streptomyces]MDX3264302.1 DUF5959 family protein [Streptomyces sp. MI02-2A]REE57709.1 hypothetical protein BX257_0076 [Streptomyces sp. 3212.3]